MDHFYYLHTNGDLVYKRFEPESDSPFVRKVWWIDFSDRTDVWRIVLEAMALNANLDRIGELASKWKLDRTDFKKMLTKIATRPTDLMKKGLPKFAVGFLGFNDIREFDRWIFNGCPLTEQEEI